MQTSEDQVVKVGASAFEGEQEKLFGYSVPNAQTGEELGTIYYKNVDQPVIDQYRKLRNGSPDGRTRGDEAKARQYLFRKAYVKFEFTKPGQELDLGDFTAKNPIEQHNKDIEFFLTKTLKVVDATIIKYLNEVFPDIDSKKSQPLPD
jgi:hypothetical protein